jgi:hypothetical protein
LANNLLNILSVNIYHQGVVEVKNLFYLVVVLVLSSSILGTVNASEIVFVDGRSGPWSLALNPDYQYTYGDHYMLSPSTITSSANLALTTGDILTITYVSGLANAGGGGIWNDGIGSVNWLATDNTTPAQYIPSNEYPVWLEELIGVYALNGVIVGKPFKIGNGPVAKSIPTGANQLLLGFNDGWYNDNGGGITVSIAESPSSSSVPAPAPLLLLGSGLLGLAGFKNKRKK